MRIMTDSSKSADANSQSCGRTKSALVTRKVASQHTGRRAYAVCQLMAPRATKSAMTRVVRIGAHAWVSASG